MFKRKPKDPSVPFTPPSTSRDVNNTVIEEEEEPFRKRLFRYFYDREKKHFCGRTCKSWILIIGYAILYLTFLTTYTLFFLYCSLLLIKHLGQYDSIDKVDLMTYSKNGIGLSATPASVNSLPVIAYSTNSNDDRMYVQELETFFKRRKRDTQSLGPCGASPFGYGKMPCIIIRINKQLGWLAKPLKNVTENIPLEIRNWMKSDKQKLWLHCQGLHSYDKEHIGRVLYYPDPPGFDPELYPLDMQKDSPLVAVQITNFTLGISLAIECTLYYEGGSSSTAFLLYVTPKKKVIISV